MFIQNKYTNWYFNIINNAKSKNRVKSKNYYFEAHHIIPKCIKSNDDIVLLTAKEHYIVHCCLVKCVEEKYVNKMKSALSKMQCFNANQHDRSSLRYVMSRKIMIGENNPFYGKKHSEESKKKMSASQTWQKGEKNPFYGKKHSLKTKKKISKAREKYTGKNHPMFGAKRNDLYWTHNKSLNLIKRKTKEEIQKLINEGWELGRWKRSKN